MKYVFFALLSIGAMSAQAQCLYFQAGYEPSQIGNVQLKASAKTVCMESRTGSQAIITLKDTEGMVLASFMSDIKEQVQCDGLCQSLEITNGFAYDSDTNPAGTKIKIETSLKPELGVTIGVLEVQAGKGFPVKAIVVGK